MKLDSQHRLRALDLHAGADHCAVGIGGVATSGRGSSRDRRVGHVVREDLNAIDVGNDTTMIEESCIIGSHAHNTSKGFTEILGSRNGSNLRSKNDHGPSTIVKRILGPCSRCRGSHLPLCILHNRVMQRKFIIFMIGIDHHVFKEDVSINSLYLNP